MSVIFSGVIIVINHNGKNIEITTSKTGLDLKKSLTSVQNVDFKLRKVVIF